VVVVSKGNGSFHAIALEIAPISGLSHFGHGFIFNAVAAGLFDCVASACDFANA
jgi:hypothetical protein